MSAGLEWHELDIPYTSAANSKNRVDASPDPLPLRVGPACRRATG
jgi:hypothetical protein